MARANAQWLRRTVDWLHDDVFFLQSDTRIALGQCPNFWLTVAILVAGNKQTVFVTTCGVLTKEQQKQAEEALMAYRAVTRYK